VLACFLEGLLRSQYSQHSYGGREGILDTVSKTSETGYLQRLLSATLNNLVVQYDGTVRNASGDIVQFTYGDDGVDASQCERVPCRFLLTVKQDIEDAYKHDLNLKAMDCFKQEWFMPKTWVWILFVCHS
jgi:DNA-directed RNA polymerase II subunit RPB1